uniref:Uncharacterized protein n=1 Tax=Arundo donax TaxID=35708 RepID=A0A0A9BSS9_ARUDO
MRNKIMMSGLKICFWIHSGLKNWLVLEPSNPNSKSNLPIWFECQKIGQNAIPYACSANR